MSAWEQSSPVTSAPGRIPPHSTLAEEQLLAACLIDGGDTVCRCIESKVKPEKFYVPANRVIYEKLVAIYEAGKAVDLVVLMEELRESRQLDEIGGLSYLTRVSGTAQTTASAGYFIEKVMELATLREIIRACTKGVEDAYSYSGGIREHVEGLEQEIFRVTQDRVADQARHISTGAKGVMASFREMAAKGGQTHGLKTGLYDLDKLTFGLQRSEMIVLAGRPSCGKTALALNFAENAGMPKTGTGGAILIFSLEMSSPQLISRLLCSRARVCAKRIKSGMVRPNAPEFIELDHAEADFGRSKIYIDDSEKITASQIRAKARRVHAKHPLALIVVDYLQLIEPADGKAPREQQVAASSRALKGMSKELDIPVLLLAQLNRASEKENRPPRLSDLRESGSIEQDADVVMILHRPESEGDNFQTASGKMNLKVAKNRNGDVGEIPLTFCANITRFENYIGE